MKVSLCLNMIVKNEAKVIRRCLDSVRPFVSAWVIVDTGSTDGTQALIREHLADLPGELYERPWRDFGTNRTEALELARGRADFLFVMDADEVIEAPPGFVLPPLELDLYQIKTILGGISYYRPQILRASLPFRYEGVLHEYLECSAPFRQGRLEGLVDRPTPDGARSADPNKYRKDAAVLEAALKASPDNARYRFYLAQSYRDAGDVDQAIVHYERRAAMGGWIEEVWVSKFEAAKLRERRGSAEPEILAAYLAAYEVRMERAESLCELARYCRSQKKFAMAYLFASEAARIPCPDDILFVDGSVYAWRALDEKGVAGYYLGKHEEAVAIATGLLEGGQLPAREVDRVRANRALSLKALAKPRP